MILISLTKDMLENMLKDRNVSYKGRVIKDKILGEEVLIYRAGNSCYDDTTHNKPTEVMK